jgi:hypothetical protein
LDRRSFPPVSPLLASQPVYPLIDPDTISPTRINCPDEGVSSLLSGLQVENPNCNQTILHHSQSIANLESQVHHLQESSCRSDKVVKDLQQLLVLAINFTKSKIQYSNDFTQVHNSINTTFNSVNMRMACIEQNSMIASAPKIYPELPFFSHVYFLGDMAETHHFCSLPQSFF